MAIPQGLSPAFQRMQEETPEEVVSQIPTGLSPAVPNAPMTFGERIEKIRNDRQHEIELAGQRWMSGEASTPEALVQVVGNYIGATSDVVGETVSSAVAAMLPDDAKNYIEELIASQDISGAIKQDPALNMLMSKYQSMSDNDKATLGGIANIINVGSGKLFMNTGKKITQSGIEAEKRRLADSMGDMSEQGRKARAGEIGNPLEQSPNTRRENDILTTLHSVSGVSMAKTPENNMKALNDELKRLRGRVEKGLAKSEKTPMSKKAVMAHMKMAMLEAEAADSLLSTNALKGHKKKAQEALEAAFDVVDDPMNIKPRELLLVRQKFDQNMQDLFSAELFVKDGTPRKFANPYREGLNNLVIGSVKDTDLQALLRRQHKLLIGKDNLSSFIATKPDIAEQTLRKVEAHPGLTMSAFATGGLVSTALQNEAAQLAVGGLTGAYTLMHPKVRQALGAAVQAQPVPVGRAGLFYGANEEQQ